MGLLAVYCCVYGDSEFDNVAPYWIQQHSNELQATAIVRSQQHCQNPGPGMLINIFGTGHVAWGMKANKVYNITKLVQVIK